jgi:hypothetical protein
MAEDLVIPAKHVRLVLFALDRLVEQTDGPATDVEDLLRELGQYHDHSPALRPGG